MVKTKKKKPADTALIRALIEEAGVSIHRIETDLKISKSTVLRGVKEDTQIPLPPKWELPIIKYLKKKIQEKNEVEIQTEEVLQEMGFKVPEKASDLREEMKQEKRSWVDTLSTD